MPRKSLSESDLEEAFLQAWKITFPGIYITQQHQFHTERRFRFDFALVPYKVAFEIQGYGTGHTSYTGMQKDYFKHNEANRLGWTILYFMSIHLTPERIGGTMSYIRCFLKDRYDVTADGACSNSKGKSLFESKLDKARRRLNQVFNPPKVPRKNS